MRVCGMLCACECVHLRERVCAFFIYTYIFLYTHAGSKGGTGEALIVGKSYERKSTKTRENESERKGGSYIFKRPLVLVPGHSAAVTGKVCPA